MKKLASLFVACTLVFGCVAFAACEEETKVDASSVTLDTAAFTLTVGETKTLTATVQPEDAADKTVTWTSSDNAIAAVADGVVTAISVGSATITATCGKATATAVCTVEPASAYEEVTSEEWMSAFDVFSNEEYRIDMDMASFAQGETPAYEDMVEYALADGKEEFVFSPMSANTAYSEKTQDGYRIYQIEYGFWAVSEGQTPLREQITGPFELLEQMFSVFAGAYDALKDGFSEETGMYTGELEVGETITDVAVAFKDGKVCKIMIVGEGEDGSSSDPGDGGSTEGSDGGADTGNVSEDTSAINYISYSISIAYDTQITLPAPAPLPAIESEQADASVLETAFDFDRLENFGITVDIVSYNADGQAERFGRMMDYARDSGKEMFRSTSNGGTIYSVRTQDEKWQFYELSGDVWDLAGPSSDSSVYVIGGLEDSLLPFAQVAFTFDTENGCYSSETTLYGTPAVVSAWFADGKLVCLSVEIEENDSPMQYLFSFSYDDQTVELPFEI